MHLLKLTSNDGTAVFLNAAHVVAVLPTGYVMPKATVILTTGEPFRVREEAATVVNLLVDSCGAEVV